MRSPWSRCNSQGETRDELLLNIRDTIQFWQEVEAEVTSLKTVETMELAA